MNAKNVSSANFIRLEELRKIRQGIKSRCFWRRFLEGKTHFVASSSQCFQMQQGSRLFLIGNEMKIIGRNGSSHKTCLWLLIEWKWLVKIALLQKKNPARGGMWPRCSGWTGQMTPLDLPGFCHWQLHLCNYGRQWKRSRVKTKKIPFSIHLSLPESSGY